MCVLRLTGKNTQFWTSYRSEATELNFLKLAQNNIETLVVYNNNNNNNKVDTKQSQVEVRPKILRYKSKFLANYQFSFH